MNVEEQRLNTFRDWPGNAAVESSRIAQAGFYFTGPGLKVTCFSCGCHISEWNYGDQVMTRHRSINPNCAFVRDPANSGNVPLMVNRSIQQTQSPYRWNRRSRNFIGGWESHNSVYKSEAARLESFNGWPISFIVTPEALAETGFYFLHQGDKVQCAFCNGIIGRWEQGDIPETEHRRHFPSCPFLLGQSVGNIPRNQTLPRSSTGERICALENFEELGIQRYRGPKHSKFSTVESRLRTFTNWPSNISQQPNELAAAGFFCVGNQQSGANDLVRCFHCDGGLKQWESQDEPWSEHARWFPHCPFLLLVKGQEYVNEIQRLYNSSVNQNKYLGEAGASNSDTKVSGLQGCLSISMPSLSNSSVQGRSGVLSRTQSVSENISLEEENRRLREDRQCKICMDADVGAVLLPCGHLVCCVDCAPSLKDCPICRQQIKATIRAFFS